eukprot:CAMPEP_0173422376 /NCGR_PEP_ID=MMETSP1357-20121228/3113_1 /TAXON_ID=77926 /ORGANISM="Hemiselmis rufescens, Strain PCC563" /LENGTH=221 /DNA_ID=CAMNT_0014385399 /DNA_START=39 /DNA_END=704 /DNA_ORIENTATION=+
MSAAQMKFLEEQRKKKAAETAASKPATPASKPTPLNSDSPISSEEAPKITKASDVWKFTEGSGPLGTYSVCRHSTQGTVVELWHEGSGSFSFRRATGAKVKYCSSYGSLQDEPKVCAPDAVEALDGGSGAAFRPGGVSAGGWGSGEVRSKRLVFGCSVKTRDGQEKIELVLTREGFVFVPAEGFKAVAVRNGEFMQLTRDEAKNMVKAADADPDGLGGGSN